MTSDLLTLRVQHEDFNQELETRALCKGRKDVGAVVAFTGLCRDEGGKLDALVLEHYPGMAEAELTRIANKALEKWSLTGLTVIHRYGEIPPGENIVLVIAASSHRRDAFEAADFMMDFLKTNAPFWKKEIPKGGGKGSWVEAKASDQADTKRWTQ
ncbi:molybdenum cofactor biosynthesis protein MoaE [Flexibacterium corallicola]|uniref:molybdenum cofactor biosynthesis protein MoaE n=1 Tax=Flexibacterium corallicola TaxID=3037259 RepID=UPI00286F56F2|nr:molybdenum cofactor biosynthesis protein MoaE [Pseudovibrio sp. M1P-2-3]